LLELLRRYLRPYAGRFSLAIATKLVEVVFNLLTPIVVARMIDEGVAQRDMEQVVRLGVLLGVFTLVGYLFTLVCQRLAANVSQHVGTDLRRDLFSHVMRLGTREVERFGSASLVTRLTSDINQVQLTVALMARMLIRWPLIAIGSMVAALLINVQLGLLLVACTLIVGGIFAYVMARSVPAFRDMQTALDDVSLITRENLSGVRVIRAFRRDEHEQARFAEASGRQARVATAVGALSAQLNPATFLVMNLGIVAILWVSGVRVGEGSVTQGEVVAFVNYMTQTLESIVYLANLVVTFTRGFACARRVMNVLDTPSSLREKAWARVPDASFSAPLLELNHVSYAYPARHNERGETADDVKAPAPAASAPNAAPAAQCDALHDVTLTLMRGATLGVIGGTGSGKSTLAALCCRLVDDTSGELSLLGRDVRDWPAQELHRLISLVPQRASLLSGTIRSNLSWRDPDASDQALWEALTRAQAADFVRELELGLDAPVEAGGRNFSGGQRQRLTIARALVGSPALVVLDDAASALDYATDARLRLALRQLAPRTATLVISQRVSAVMSADLILVLDHGEVAGLGSHRELMESCPLYREICLTQLRPEEVSA
jgi:ATP-binding cassette subfamily B protein